MKGIADIEIINVNTGEIKKYTEYNRLSALLDNIYNDDLYDGCIERTKDLTSYFKKLVLLTGNIDNSNALLSDGTNVLKVIDTKAQKYEDEQYKGYQFNFELGTDIEGTIKCISLAPSEFINLEGGQGNTQNSSMVRGTRSIHTNLNENIIKIDVENSLIYTLSFDSIDSYTTGGEFNFYINKYYHNFKELCLFDNEELNAKLLEATTIDVSNIFEGLQTPIFTNSNYTATFKYAIDEHNNNLAIILMPKDSNEKKINIIALNLDDTTKMESHNMTIPNELELLVYNNENKLKDLEMIPVHNGRLIFKAEYNDETMTKTTIIGMNYLDSTDFVLYDTDPLERSLIPYSKQMLGTNYNNMISEYITIKDNKAFITEKTKVGFYYNSKIINITNSEISYDLSKYDISTINNLSKSILKTNQEIIKIKYKIVQEKEAS